jgi:alpha-galactosidase
LKIAIIGAGSASFGPATIATIVREPGLNGSELVLIDKDPTVLEIIHKVAERMNEEWGAELTIRAGTDRRLLLADSDFVIVSIETGPREKLWRLDWELPIKHGLRQPYAENGGPGGLIHAFRQIPEFMDIARDMEILCPDAWLVNFSNPLPRITRALTKYSNIKVVGKCHQINQGYALVAELLGSYIDENSVKPKSSMQNSKSSDFERAVEIGRNHFEIRSAGLNHLIWLLEIKDKQTGEDLYPILRSAIVDSTPKRHPLTLDLFDIFGLCPLAGDAHLAEYLPWVHDPLSRPWERYGISLYDWEVGAGDRNALLNQMAAISTGTDSLESLRDSRSEGAVEIIRAIWLNEAFYDEAENVPNHGSIDGLLQDTIVELPAVVDREGIRGVEIDHFPEGILEILRREASLVEIVVDAAVIGDRQLALQALLLDPMINDIDRARAILDDYLQSFAQYLPQFEGS